MLKTVTMTGADDSVQPKDLLELQNDFPFLESGILLSRSSAGRPRFPSQDWLYQLAWLKERNPSLKLSGHVCGSWVRELLLGDDRIVSELTRATWNVFDRIQLNTHGVPHQFTQNAFKYLADDYPEKEFILQYDNVNAFLVEQADKAGLNHSLLFDLSHGAGVLPDEWPEPIEGQKCGYAGGLSTANVLRQLEQIEMKMVEKETWIDAETHLRSDNDIRFDLVKVSRFLDIVKPYVNPEII